VEEVTCVEEVTQTPNARSRAQSYPLFCGKVVFWHMKESGGEEEEEEEVGVSLQRCGAVSKMGT
jgi:hypothetical protein